MKNKNLGSIIVDDFRMEFLKKSFESIGSKQTLLDLGCGRKPYEKLYNAFANHSIGADVSFSSRGAEKADIIIDGKELPFKDAAFGIVLCTEVLEHVPRPQQFLKEIYRVLQKDGYLILTTPFLVPIHEDPFDFYRFTMNGLNYLIGEIGFSVVSIEPFSEIFGVQISFLMKIQLKFWHAVSKILRLPVFSSLFNPFIFIFVFLPQLGYLGLIKLMRSISFMRNVIKKLSYTTIGYGLVANK